jgi:polyphenol oxidase
MEPFLLKNQSSLSIESWEKSFPRLITGISTKNGGDSKGHFETLNLGFHVGDVKETVCSNRSKLSKQLQFPLEHWIGAEQIHDTLIRKITKSDRGKGANSYSNAFEGTDGFYTKEEGILLTLCYADCVPLFFISPQYKMIGAAHAGWKGTVNEIARYMIEAWNREGVESDNIFVAIGPSICEKCYIVNDYVINFVENILVHTDKKPYNLLGKGQYTLDLPELNKLILMRAGVPEENILITSLCTSCDDNMFFSHRRDKGKTGRMLSYIGWKETEGEGSRKS